MSPGETQFTLTYVVSPIFLTGGIAASLSGGTMPIIALTQGNNFTSLTSPAGNVDLDDYFAHYAPLPGSSLIAQDIGTYPFANQQTAANAIITKPLAISMLMIAPARQPGDYFLKSAIMSGLRTSLNYHNLSGGTYTVVTPAFVYTDCIMTAFHDASDSETKQVQWRWQLDFQKPLVSLADASIAQSALYASIGAGQQVTPNAQGNLVPGGALGPTVPGPSSAFSPSVVPSTASNPAPAGGFSLPP